MVHKMSFKNIMILVNVQMVLFVSLQHNVNAMVFINGNKPVACYTSLCHIVELKRLTVMCQVQK